MSASVVWTGLEELKAGLRNLPPELAAEASPIVTGAAEGAKADIRYPRRSGNLADGLKVETVSAGPFGAGAVLKNTSKLAQIFEKGSEARHYYTVNGVKHLTGKMPAGNVFIPAVVRRRRAMYDELKALLVRAGLQVSGDA